MSLDQRFKDNEALQQRFREKMKLKESKQQRIDELYARSQALEKERGSGELLRKQLEGIASEIERLTLEVKDLDMEARTLLAQYEEEVGGTIEQYHDGRVEDLRANIRQQEQKNLFKWILLGVLLVTVIALLVSLMSGNKA